jgi:hypothetical protein
MAIYLFSHLLVCSKSCEIAIYFVIPDVISICFVKYILNCTAKRVQNSYLFCNPRSCKFYVKCTPIALQRERKIAIYFAIPDPCKFLCQMQTHCTANRAQNRYHTFGWDLHARTFCKQEKSCKK